MLFAANFNGTCSRERESEELIVKYLSIRAKQEPCTSCPALSLHLLSQCPPSKQSAQDSLQQDPRLSAAGSFPHGPWTVTACQYSKGG